MKWECVWNVLGATRKSAWSKLKNKQGHQKESMSKGRERYKAQGLKFTMHLLSIPQFSTCTYYKNINTVKKCTEEGKNKAILEKYVVFSNSYHTMNWILIFPFYRWRIWCFEMLTKLSKIIKLRRDRTKSQTSVFYIHMTCISPYAMLGNLGGLVKISTDVTKQRTLPSLDEKSKQAHEWPNRKWSQTIKCPSGRRVDEVGVEAGVDIGVKQFQYTLWICIWTHKNMWFSKRKNICCGSTQKVNIFLLMMNVQNRRRTNPLWCVWFRSHLKFAIWEPNFNKQ